MWNREGLFSISLVMLLIISGMAALISIPDGMLPFDLTNVGSAAFAGGDGTASNPYQISNITQLQNVNNDLNAHYILINNIDASETKSWNSGKGFISIANDNDSNTNWYQGEPFKGSFNGQGYSILNLFINRNDEDFIGLFAFTASETSINNVTLINTNMTGRDYVGGIIGNGNSVINNCNINGRIKGVDYCGGGFGYNHGEMFNCSASVTVDGNFHIGGIVGYYKGIADNCTSNSQITGVRNIGGLFGRLRGNCYDSETIGSVTGEENVGGFVGLHQGIISKSYSLCQIDGINNDIGGFVGENQGTISNCYSISNITGSNAGGFAGSNSLTIKKCYSSGFLFRSSNGGGFIERNIAGDITQCFWDKDTSEITNSNGGEGKTTNEMIVKSTYSNRNWDFNSVWKINENMSYPFFGREFNSDIYIETNPILSIDEDTEYYINFNASDIDKIDVEQFWTLYTNADWLSLKNNTGILSGVPLNENVGEWFVKIRAMDGRGSIKWSNFTVTVENVNDDPSYLTEDVFVAIEGGCYSVNYEFEDIDPTNDEITITMISNHSWLNYDYNENILFGNPENEDVGSDWVNISAVDDKGGLSWSNFTLTVENVNNKPIITTTYLPDAIEDEYYCFQINATDIDPTNDQLEWNLVDCNALFLSISRYGGILKGTPSNEDVGSFWIQLEISDGNGGDLLENYSLTVRNVNDEPIINDFYYDDILQGDDFSIIFSGSDIDKTGDVLSWILQTNASFLSIDPIYGNLSGIPTNDDVGAWWVNVSVSDGNGGTDWVNFTLTILNNNDGPTLNVTELALTIEEDSEGISLNLNDVFLDIDGDLLSFDHIESENLFISIKDGMAMIIPYENWCGFDIIRFTASDGFLSVSINATIEVTPINDAPSGVQIIAESSYLEGADQVVDSSVDDPDFPFGDKLTFTWNSNISGDIGIGQSINLSLLAGSHLITLTVTDIDGRSATATKEIEILPDEGVDDDPDDVKDKEKGIPILWIIIGVFIVFVIVAVIIALLLLKKKKDVEEPQVDSENDVGSIKPQPLEENAPEVISEQPAAENVGIPIQK